MFRKITLLSAITLAALSTQAQMNVGSTTAPDAGAILQLTSTNRGILPPKVALATSLTTYGLNGGSPVEGMTVYNTSTTAPFSPGLYVWQNSSWTKFTAGTVTGNVTAYTANATSAASDFFVTLSNNGTTYTMPAPASYTGRMIVVRNSNNTAVVNVKVAAGNLMIEIGTNVAVNNIILSGTERAVFVSDGTSWIRIS